MNNRTNSVGLNPANATGAPGTNDPWRGRPYIDLGPKPGSPEYARAQALMKRQREIDAEISELMRKRRTITSALIVTVPGDENL
jgi:hypothetical protein